MLFNTVEFAVFLPLVALLYFLFPGRWRIGLLLLASYYFYICWRWEYILLILAQTEINYLCGLGIGRSKTQQRKKVLLVAALASTLAILFFFKYVNFAADTVASFSGAIGHPWTWTKFSFLLPVGISFHTFQTLSYTIDVYRGRVAPEKHFGKFALFVSFFPLLVAGPIERAGNLLPQFAHERKFLYGNIAIGLRLILWGLIKKMAIADRVGAAVNTVYSDPHAFPGPLLVLATFFFAIQIYCDFSGYSDIAIGAARIFGYELMTNFRMPYFSTSLGEFWQRWHISLSTWFRDYVYVPLGGSRVSGGRWAVNILAVFALSGLWHGASWTFVIWGAIHGTWLVAEKALSLPAARALHFLKLSSDLWFIRGVRWLIVFTIVLCSWVFFKASSVGQALSILIGFMSLHGLTFAKTLQMGLPVFELGLAFTSIALLVCVDAVWCWQPAPIQKLWARRWLRWSVCIAGFYFLIFFGVYGRVEFIYFQF